LHAEQTPTATLKKIVATFLNIPKTIYFTKEKKLEIKYNSI
jgi:hypothetical protein